MDSRTKSGPQFPQDIERMGIYTGKSQVCKTLIRRFDPDPHLQSHPTTNSLTARHLSRRIAAEIRPKCRIGATLTEPPKTANLWRRLPVNRTASRTASRTAPLLSLIAEIQAQDGSR